MMANDCVLLFLSFLKICWWSVGHTKCSCLLFFTSPASNYILFHFFLLLLVLLPHPDDCQKGIIVFLLPHWHSKEYFIAGHHGPSVPVGVNLFVWRLRAISFNKLLVFGLVFELPIPMSVMWCDVFFFMKTHACWMGGKFLVDKKILFFGKKVLYFKGKFNVVNYFIYVCQQGI